jgi:hypothetical protein
MKIKDSGWILPVFFGLSLAGCAGMSYKTVDGGAGGAADQKEDGVRYYEAAPYLFIHSDGKGGVTGEIVWLPDRSVLKAVHPYAWFASNSVTLKFTNGVLQEASSTVDETVIPNAVLSAAASFFKFAAVKQQTNVGQVPVPYLFRIVTTGDSVELKGGPVTTSPIYATVSQGSK